MKTTIIYEAPQVLIDFLGYMQTVKGKSPKTVDEYYIDLRTFFRYIKSDNFYTERNISDIFSITCLLTIV